MKSKIFLLPGTMCTELLWQEFYLHFDSIFTFIHLDIPKHHDFDQLAQYYLTFFERELQNNQQVNIIGFSLGGYIAAYLACKHPHLINKLFIIANTPTQLSNNEITQRKDIVNYIKQNNYKGMSRNRICSMLDSSNQSDKLINIIKAMESALGAEHLISQYENTTKRVDLYLELSQRKSKTVLYFSENDALINKQWLSKLGNNENIDIQVTSGKGHMLPLEKPLELACLIKRWIK